MGGIERPQTEEEKRDYERLGKLSPWQRFLARLSKVEQGFVIKHEPFDSACAKLDYKDLLERVGKESERAHGYVQQEDVDSVKFDYEKYGDKSRFELVATDDDMEQQVVTVGSKNVIKNAIIGRTLKYVCKQRGHGVSVFMTVEEYDDKFKKGKKED